MARLEESGGSSDATDPPDDSSAEARAPDAEKSGEDVPPRSGVGIVAADPNGGTIRRKGVAADAADIAVASSGVDARRIERGSGGNAAAAARRRKGTFIVYLPMRVPPF
mmetsp:Transcript_23178/g.47019  ORF Transcript_23178/g.47019 Transcript_23178/m.47019 type:complete len:109 (-) Transcript_23178:10-336(-)